MSRILDRIEDVRFEPAASRIGSDWFLRVTFPNGEIAQVRGFVSEIEARRWIQDEAAAWVLSYCRGRRLECNLGGSRNNSKSTAQPARRSQKIRCRRP